MKTLGIDLASQHTGTAACRILWEGKVARIEEVEDASVARVASQRKLPSTAALAKG
jgi:nucleoid-associated protein YgaU